jgi:hypothetical protein
MTCTRDLLINAIRGVATAHLMRGSRWADDDAFLRPPRLQHVELLYLRFERKGDKERPLRSGWSRLAEGYPTSVSSGSSTGVALDIAARNRV